MNLLSKSASNFASFISILCIPVFFVCNTEFSILFFILACTFLQIFRVMETFRFPVFIRDYFLVFFSCEQCFSHLLLSLNAGPPTQSVSHFHHFPHHHCSPKVPGTWAGFWWPSQWALWWRTPGSGDPSGQMSLPSFNCKTVKFDRLYYASKTFLWWTLD